MIVDRNTGNLRDTIFRGILDYLGPEDMIVINNSKVIPARLFGHKKTGTKIELLLLKEAAGLPLEGNGRVVWECLLKPARRITVGETIQFSPELTACVTAAKPKGIFEVALVCKGDFWDTVEKIGHVPLPPYIRRPDQMEDRQRYQTVYAQDYGSVAAPTAGLHFSRSLLRELTDRGVEMVNVTLHVGLGTFQPMRKKDVRDHDMHQEMVEVTPEAADRINRAIESGKRIVAVGTTTVRVLEFMAGEGRAVKSGREPCDLYIYPGFHFKIVEAMVTNFHLPRSSLLMLCSAFAGTDLLLKTYHEAIRRRYRFYSYGDAMMIV